MTGTPRNVRYGSSPASLKVLEPRMRARVVHDDRPHLLGDQTGQPLGDAHADLPDAFRPQADGCRQHEVGAVGLEQVDRADVGREPLPESRLTMLVSVSEGLPLRETSWPISSMLLPQSVHAQRLSRRPPGIGRNARGEARTLPRPLGIDLRLDSGDRCDPIATFQYQRFRVPTLLSISNQRSQVPGPR